MPDWVIALQKPWWYPGDAALEFANQLFALVYPLFAFVFIAAMYRIIKDNWPWWYITPFLANVVATFAFIVIGATYESLLGTAIDVLLMWIFLAWAFVLIYKRSYWLTALMIPYAVWLTVFVGIYVELLRVN